MFRTVVRDGLIVVNTHGEIPDGTPVDVVPRNGKHRVRAKEKPKRATKQDRAKERFLELFGVWKNRPEWKGMSGLEIHREIRRKALGGGSRG